MSVEVASPPEFEAAAAPARRDSRTVPRDAARLLSIIIPTRNESGNIQPLLAAIQAAAGALLAEVIFVDDSRDDTPAIIRKLQGTAGLVVRLIARGPSSRGNGLGGAVVEGMRIASGAWVCVMDADLQHPPALIPELLEKARQTGADLVIGSRLAAGGDASSLGARRRISSLAFRLMARFALPLELRKVTDPLSGFFLLRRSAVDLDGLHPVGFKILLEILARCPGLAVAELPFRFGYRLAGRSKASALEVLRFVRAVLRLRLAAQPRFVRFLGVGASGLVVNTLAVAAATEWLGVYYLTSVALATVVSTTWNFALTETWVFRDRRNAPGRPGRFLQFIAMNLAALALRGPIVLALTSVLGVHYLLSNILSFAALTILRFLVSDRLVWRDQVLAPPPADSEEPPVLTAARARRSELLSDVHYYDIHGLVTVASDAALPELEYFRNPGAFAQPSIRVRLGGSAPTGARRIDSLAAKSSRMLYDEGLLGLGFHAEIFIGAAFEVYASPALRWSPHVLYTNLVEPILRWAFVEKGFALVHGACLDHGGRAYLITARTDTGKTTTLLQILYRQRRKTDKFAFVSDDLTLISADGDVLTYPKPLTISRHTAQAVDVRTLSPWQRLALPLQSRVHSRSGRRLAHLLARTKLPMATINAFVQYLVPPPKYHIQALVPGVKLARRSQLAGMFVIERSDHDSETVLDSDQAVDVLVANSEDAYGFPPYDAIKAFLYGSNGSDLRSRERAIIDRALRGRPVTRLSSSGMDWWGRLSRNIEQRAALQSASNSVVSSEP